jgi:hypothetical protein
VFKEEKMTLNDYLDARNIMTADRATVTHQARQAVVDAEDQIRNAANRVDYTLLTNQAHRDAYNNAMQQAFAAGLPTLTGIPAGTQLDVAQQGRHLNMAYGFNPSQITQFIESQQDQFSPQIVDRMSAQGLEQLSEQVYNPQLNSTITQADQAAVIAHVGINPANINLPGFTPAYMVNALNTYEDNNQALPTNWTQRQPWYIP